MKGDKYLGLKKHLEQSGEHLIKLSFEQIEGLIGDKLPNSATDYPEAWWSNNYDHSQAISWMDAGYETDFVSDTYSKREIVFVKCGI